MVEGLYRLFDSYIHEKEQVFVLAFLDLIAEYVQKENTDLGRFLTWWEDSGIRKTIATPDGQNAIRILTVHKSIRKKLHSIGYILSRFVIVHRWELLFSPVITFKNVYMPTSTT